MTDADRAKPKTRGASANPRFRGCHRTRRHIGATTKEAAKHVTHGRRTATRSRIYKEVCDRNWMNVTYLTASLVVSEALVPLHSDYDCLAMNLKALGQVGVADCNRSKPLCKGTSTSAQ